MTEPEDKGGLQPAEAERLATDLLTRLLGTAPRALAPLGGGLSNHVFKVDCADEGDLVLRMSAEPAKVKQFLKEQWAIGRVREAGVPVPEVLEVGSDPVAHMVSRQVPGREATDHPARPEILRALGVQARRIHGIATSGFGQTFDWSENVLSRSDTWHEYVAREFRGEARLEVLARHDMLRPDAVVALRRTLGEIAGWDVDPRLNHGDLRLKNVIADEQGGIAAIIDWELCTSNAAPFWDLALALHDLGIDAKEAFLDGYGMSPDEIVAAAPAIRAFNVLNYAAAVERAVEADDARALAKLRLRLHGAMDLYAF